MNQSINNSIQIMNYGTNIAFLLNDNSDYLATEHKIVQSQSEISLVECIQTTFNEKTQLFYITKSYSPLTHLLPHLNSSQFEMILNDVLTNILRIKQNGFLTCESTDISFDHIYIDEKSLKTYLLYIPCRKRLYPTAFDFESYLKEQLTVLPDKFSQLNSVKMRQIIGLFNDGKHDLETIHNYLKTQNIPVNEQKPREQNAAVNLVLVAVNAPTQFEIAVTKNEYIIGRSKNGVDCTVPFNKAIGRRHCKVCRVAGGYTITDLESANGTFLNHQRLIPNKSYPIKSGDSIRLSNSEFTVEMR